MNNEFDELVQGIAQAVTRRGALKRFGFGPAGITMAAPIGCPPPGQGFYRTVQPRAAGSLVP